jgi:hypothetical protein
MTILGKPVNITNRDGAIDSRVTAISISMDCDGFARLPGFTVTDGAFAAIRPATMLIQALSSLTL